MNKFRKFLNHSEGIALLFFFCTALFGWPFISITGPSSPESMFVYLFLVWGAVILMLYWISRSCGKQSSNREQKGEN